MPGLVALTGASGFIGRVILQKLVNCGYKVRALVRKPQPDTESVHWIQGDLSNNTAALRTLVQDAFAIIHCAGRVRGNSLETFIQTNVEGTATVLAGAQAAGVERFVHISTVVVIGNTRRGQLIDETAPSQPLDPYQRTKMEGEDLVRAYHQERGLPIIILRPGAFYGR